ncbi:MAG: glycoside hydrolase family 88 protein [Bacteroidales bacterium]|nr:glycoside hydrolase family 88 protein [Bacteroidales bacterium]
MKKTHFQNAVIFLFIFIQGSLSAFSQTTIIIQAEDADTIYLGSIDTDHSGYTGSGFLNLDNSEGPYSVYIIDLPCGTLFEASIVYCNGTVADRTMDVIINDTLVQEDLVFPITADWDTWDTVSFDASLIMGTNIIKLIGTGGYGAPNLDYIQFYSPSISLDFKPVAQNDSVSIYNNQATTIHVVDNDFDYNGDELTLSFVSDPQHGTAVIMENVKDIRYNPGFNHIGSDDFTYIINDGTNHDTAKVVVSIDSVDWSVAMADMVLATRTPATAGSWNYTVGLLMEGILRVYKRTGENKYLNFVEDWADLHVSANGEVDNNFGSLDNMMPGFMLLHLYSETGINKYKLACDSIRKRYNSYPYTTDSGFWHNVGLPGELWLDGLYMSMPFMATYGKMFNDEEFAYHKVTKNFTVYLDHLMNDQTGIPVHAYDEDGSESWALPPQNRSPHHWGRSIGWVVMALTDIVDVIPSDYPGKDTLISLYTTVLEGLVQYQDTVTGLWYQVVDKADSSQNWHETSCTMMYTLSLRRAIQKGYLDPKYEKNVKLGYMGALSKASIESNSMVYLTDICQGTSVSADMNYYFNRARNTNDNHGMGSFFIMNELVAYNNLPWNDPDVGIYKYKNTRTLDITIYPNPANKFIVLDCQNAGQFINMELFSITGEMVKQKESTLTTGECKVHISVEDLPNGIYLYRITSTNGSMTRQIVVMK